MKNNIIILSLGLILLGGCTRDNRFAEPAADAVTFTAGIETKTRTTSGGDTWVVGDAVGVFMLTEGGDLSIPADVLAGNRQYSVSNASTGELTSANGTPIYYPRTGNVDFAAYYPYGTVTAGVYSISLGGQTSEDAQNGLDVLYAKSTGVAKSGTAVSLVFGHVLSKITINVKLGNGLEGLSGDKITAVVFSGMPRTATLALQDGTLTAGAAGDFSALKAATASVGADATFTALLVPQLEGGANRTAVFIVDDKQYIWTIPNTEAFVAGNHYTYPVTVKLTGVTVGDPTIADWTTNDNGSGEAVKLDVVRIPAAGKTFLMGSSDGSANGSGSPGDLNYTPAEPGRSSGYENQHKVTFTKDFYMSKYEVTNAQYAAFLNAKGVQGETMHHSMYGPMTGGKCTWGDWNGQHLFYEGGSDWQWGVKWDTDKWIPQTGYDDHPMIWVTWYGAYEYAVWAGGSLPTEAQWEYACRGGKENMPFGIGTGYKLDYMLANFYWGGSWSWDGSAPTASITSTGSYPATTQAVGTYPYANGYGLYDMHGNVHEWCSDWRGQYYGAANAAELTSGVTTDPTGAAAGFARVLRGGYWESNAQNCRSAYRLDNDPGYTNYANGFRVVFPAP